MKQLLIIAILAISAFTAKAQFAQNTSNCDVEFRELCISPMMCSISYTGPWVKVPIGGTPVTLPGAGCTPPDEAAYEVRFDPSTGCTGSVIVKVGMLCNAVYPMMALMPPCPCSPNPDGPNVHFNGLNLHIDP